MAKLVLSASRKLHNLYKEPIGLLQYRPYMLMNKVQVPNLLYELMENSIIYQFSFLKIFNFECHTLTWFVTNLHYH